MSKYFTAVSFDLTQFWQNVGRSQIQETPVNGGKNRFLLCTEIQNHKKLWSELTPIFWHEDDVHMSDSDRHHSRVQSHNKLSIKLCWVFRKRKCGKSFLGDYVLLIAQSQDTVWHTTCWDSISIRNIDATEFIQILRLITVWSLMRIFWDI